MADYKKYKVGITVKEPWANNISYEQLDMTLFAVENGGDGCAYVALKPNIGVRPNQDPTTWIKATQRGQSIYDYCIEYELFEGTEEEFAQDYADAVQAAKDAAASATHVEEVVSAAEQGRVSAENARVSAESQRASAEKSRVSYETQRSVNETGRVNAEDSRVAAENARVVEESQRVSAESTRATNEENRRAEFGGMMRDADTAIGLVDAAMTEAENVDATVDGMIVTITDRHGVSKSVNIGFDIYRTYGSVAAMNADAANVENGKFVMIATLDPTSTENAQLWVRNSNAATSQNPFTFISDLDQASSAAWADWMENQKPIIEADHTTAVADHTQAVSDHTNATNDHAVAGQDHTTAGADHTQAVSDSTRAGQDHSVAQQDHTRAEGDHTTASTDHSTAQSDHTTAETDHTTASSDHTIASGDHTTALSDHDIASGDHTTAGTDHTRAESDHTTASGDHTRAESDHTLAASDHTTASSDHGIASTDHTTAQGDHTQAGDDHTIASADHANATSDHTLAGNDHTRAESDHSTAAEDHTNAAADHTQAGEDHAQYLIDHESIASKANVAPNPTEGNVAALDSGGNPIDSGIPSEKVAKTDGFYEGMGVGVAKRLEGNTDVAGSFLERTTGGDAELANGLAQLNEVQGGSVKFNQLVQNGDFSDGTTKWLTYKGSISVSDNVLTYTTWNNDAEFLSVGQTNINPVRNHKIYIACSLKAESDCTCGLFLHKYEDTIKKFSVKSDRWTLCRYIASDTKSGRETTAHLYVYAPNISNFSIYLRNVVCIDLTAIFGAGNEPETVEDFEAWLAENVGLKDYYDYTEGEVVNNNMTGIESTGFNLFNPTTGKARIIGAYSEVYGNYYGITGTHGTLTFEDDLGNVSTVTPDADGKFELDVSGYLSVADAGNDVAVFLWWDGKKTGYEDYDVEIAHLDVRHIYGKKNGTGELVQVWPTGMPKINDIVDKLCIENGAVVAKRPLGEVDLGSLNWITFGSTPYVYRVLNFNGVVGTNIITAKYEAKSYGNTVSDDKTITVAESSGTVALFVHDASYLDTTTLASALSGQKLYFELATPETYTDLVYIGSEYFADGTPVALPVNYKVDNWGVESILPKNTNTILTAKPTIKVRYAIDAVEQLNTHSDKIEDLYEGLDELDGAKANTVGVYDDMVVGAAKAIAGNQRLDKEFTSMVVDGADGVAKINEVRGKSLVWNQKLNQTPSASEHITVTNNNGVSTATVTNTDVYYFGFNFDGVFTIDHKYFLKFKPSNITQTNGAKFDFNGFVNNYGTIAIDTNIKKVIGTANRTGRFGLYLTTGNGAVFFNQNDTFTIEDYILIDLTQMFGAGNEPATVEEFENLFPDAYYEYNAGEIINNATEKLDVTGFNQWDEEYYQNKYYNSSGVLTDLDGCIASKNDISVLPNTTYYLHFESTATSDLYLLQYDGSKTLLSRTNIENTTFTTSADCHFIRFSTNSNYGSTYKNDICINISDPSRNGTYEPYKHGVVPLNLSTITGKQVGVEDAESVVIFPDGMRQAGSVADTLLVDDDGYARRALVKVGSVDLGNLAWDKQIQEQNGNVRFTSLLSGYNGSNRSGIVCSKYTYDIAPINWISMFVDKSITGYEPNRIFIMDSAYSEATAGTFKAAMAGVELIYELAEYKEYILDEPILMTFKAYHGGTIVQSPQAPDSAPMSMNVTFALDAVGTLNNLPKNYISADSMDAFLAQLGTAMNGTWTKSWDAANNRYGFTFTPNA